MEQSVTNAGFVYGSWFWVAYLEFLIASVFVGMVNEVVMQIKDIVH